MNVYFEFCRVKFLWLWRPKKEMSSGQQHSQQNESDGMLSTELDESESVIDVSRRIGTLLEMFPTLDTVTVGEILLGHSWSLDMSFEAALALISSRDNMIDTQGICFQDPTQLKIDAFNASALTPVKTSSQTPSASPREKVHLLMIYIWIFHVLSH